MVAKMPRGSRAYVIRELMFDDLDYIAANLRPADAKELEAASGHTNYRDRLTMSVALSEEVRVVECDGVPILVFGLAPISDAVAAIWACGTSSVSRFRRSFVEDSRAMLQSWFDARSKLVRLANFAHADNTVHHRWLKAVGATLHPEEPVGHRGAMFRPFTIDREALPCAIQA